MYDNQSKLREGNTRVRFYSKQKSVSYIKAALYLGIVLLCLASFFFTARSANLKDERLVFKTVSPLIDASGEDSIFETSAINPELILSQELPVIHGVDLQEVYTEEQPHIKDEIEGDVYFDLLPDDIKLEIIKYSNDEPQEFFVGTQGPQILIYHTHTQEAYRQIYGEEYIETGSWRTAEHAQSVVAVGEVLKAELEDYGYTVLHDTKNHEPPKLSTSYDRSLETMLLYQNQYPTISVFIDVHRDAYGDIESGMKDYVTINGDECSRVMFVVGTGEKYNDKPNYESNYKLALALTNELESIQEGFTRPIRVKTGRYNQHVADMCLLIEVGHNANSLEQAKNTAKYVALALSRILNPR